MMIKNRLCLNQAQQEEGQNCGDKKEMNTKPLMTEGKEKDLDTHKSGMKGKIGNAHRTEALLCTIPLQTPPITLISHP